MAVFAAAGLTAGCTTTMQEAARLQLNSARMRTSELSTRVAVAGRVLRVTRVAVLSGHSAEAFIVDVRNGSGRPSTDLPISVGVRMRGGRSIYLNGQSGLDDFYFDAHLPLVAPGQTLTWVYTLHRRLPAGGKPFATVGARPAPAVAAPEQTPVIRATALRTKSVGSAAGAEVVLRVALDNLSGVPQYQLPVYAFSQVAGRYVAAGTLTVPELAGQQRETLDLGLIGRPNRGRVEVEVRPSIFQ